MGLGFSDETSAIAIEGRRWRRAVKQARELAKECGLAWREVRQIAQQIGWPGQSSESQAAWLEQAKAICKASAVNDGRDWDAFFAALADFIVKVAPVILEMFAACGA